MNIEEKLREDIANLIQDNSSNIIDNIISGAGMPTKTWSEVATQILVLPEIQLTIKLLEQTQDDCPECNKAGSVYKFRSNISHSAYDKCEVCHGTGKTEPHPERIVILDKDQKLPRNKMSMASKLLYATAEEARQDMLADNWKRIKR